MPNIANRIGENQRRWDAFHYHPSSIADFDHVSKQLISHKDQYQAISDEIFRQKNVKVPWAVIAVVDQREHAETLGLVNSYLGNGQSLNHETTIAPEGRGPFLKHDTDTPLHGPFFRGALDALIDVQKIQNWVAEHGDSIGSWLTFLESLNGFGYANGPKGNPPMSSPYIWGGTSEQEIGKYIRDGVFDKTVWDPQLGCAGMLRYMSGLDNSVGFGPKDVPSVPSVPVPTPIPTPVPVPSPAPTSGDSTMGALLPAILQIVMGSPALTTLLSSLISNPTAVQAITQVLTGLSAQVASGVTPQQAMANLILTQYDLDQAAAVVAAEFTKLGLPPLTVDQARELTALVIRNYIMNQKAGK